MTSHLSPKGARALRALALTLGLAAMAMQGLAPLCLAGWKATPGGTSSIICTEHGREIVRIDAEGKPLPGTPSPSRQDSTCPLCAAFQAASLFAAPVVAWLLISGLRLNPRIVVSSSPATPRPPLSYVSRAPPGWGFQPA